MPYYAWLASLDLNNRRHNCTTCSNCIQFHPATSNAFVLLFYSFLVVELHRIHRSSHDDQPVRNANGAKTLALGIVFVLCLVILWILLTRSFSLKYVYSTMILSIYHNTYRL